MTLPRFLGEASLYKTAAHYRLAAIWNEGSESQWVPAQFFRSGVGEIGGPKGCTDHSVDVSICPSRCQRICDTGQKLQSFAFPARTALARLVAANVCCRRLHFARRSWPACPSTRLQICCSRKLASKDQILSRDLVKFVARRPEYRCRSYRTNVSKCV
jgi:hypothetical protein